MDTSNIEGFYNEIVTDAEKSSENKFHVDRA